MRMENMATWQLLWRVVQTVVYWRWWLLSFNILGSWSSAPEDQFISANDASLVVHIPQFLERRIGILVLHVLYRLSVTDEVHCTCSEVSNGNVNVTDCVEGYRVENRQDGEVREVDYHLGEACISSV